MNCNFSLTVTKEQRTDAIYSIPSNDCDHECIGQTKRQFDTRLKEHQKAVFFCKKKKFSFIGAHMPNQNIKPCLIVHLVAM